MGPALGEYGGIYISTKGLSLTTRTADHSVLQTLPRFLLVGASGVVVNQALLGALHLGLHIPLLLASALATETAIANNYWWNEHWTFDCGAPDLRRFLYFNGVALVGLAMTVTTLGLLVRHVGLAPLVANLFAIGAGTISNYTASHLWVWRGAKDVHSRPERSEPTALGRDIECTAGRHL